MCSDGAAAGGVPAPCRGERVRRGGLQQRAASIRMHSEPSVLTSLDLHTPSPTHLQVVSRQHQPAAVGEPVDGVERAGNVAGPIIRDAPGIYDIAVCFRQGARECSHPVPPSRVSCVCMCARVCAWGRII